MWTPPGRSSRGFTFAGAGADPRSTAPVPGAVAPPRSGRATPGSPGWNAVPSYGALLLDVVGASGSFFSRRSP